VEVIGYGGGGFACRAKYLGGAGETMIMGIIYEIISELTSYLDNLLTSLVVALSMQLVPRGRMGCARVDIGQN
jgi:hypothetical protein